MTLEIIEMLKILKESAKENDVDTLIEDVKIDSFNFVMDKAIKALGVWDNLFKSYEVLVDNITDLTATEATGRVDEWCIEQLRGILSDYYADKMEKEILEAQAESQKGDKE